MAINKLQWHKSPGIDKIPAELIKAGAGQFILYIYVYTVYVCSALFQSFPQVLE
jgi:hypothetical protein